MCQVRLPIVFGPNATDEGIHSASTAVNALDGCVRSVVKCEQNTVAKRL